MLATILVAESSAMIRRRVRNSLADEASVDRIYEVTTASSLQQWLLTTKADIYMVQQTLIADFKQFPARSLLVLATEVNELILHEACRYEALGYLLETAPGECFRMSLHQKPGQFLLDPTLTSMGLKAYFEKHEDALLEELTAREREVLLLMREGCSNREIALQLQICEDTVKKHVAHIYKN